MVFVLIHMIYDMSMYVRIYSNPDMNIYIYTYIYTKQSMTWHHRAWIRLTFVMCFILVYVLFVFACLDSPHLVLHRTVLGLRCVPRKLARPRK